MCSYILKTISGVVKLCFSHSPLSQKRMIKTMKLFLTKRLIVFETAKMLMLAYYRLIFSIF